MAAATEWFKFDPDDAFAPRPGEWCLWSFVTEHGREYYSGSRLLHEGEWHVRTEYGWWAPLRDAYWARVNKLGGDGDVKDEHAR